MHVRRSIVELQATWIRSLKNSRITATGNLWQLIVESGYLRAADELEHNYVSCCGEMIFLWQKLRSGGSRSLKHVALQ